MRIASEFAMIDVKKGRRELARAVRDGQVRIPVTLVGFITGPYGQDDGMSIEFEVDVKKVELGAPEPNPLPKSR